MYNDIERFRRMASMAQIGWWEADFTAGHYICSEYLCDLLELEGNIISFKDFRERVRKDYQEQIVREFNAYIHKEFYEQTFPIHTKEGIVWLHTRLGDREEIPGRGVVSFGIIQRVKAPDDSSEPILARINDLLYRVPAEIIVQSEQPTGSLSDKDAAEMAKSGVATQIIP